MDKTNNKLKDSEQYTSKISQELGVINTRETVLNNVKTKKFNIIWEGKINYRGS